MPFVFRRKRPSDPRLLTVRFDDGEGYLGSLNVIANLLIYLVIGVGDSPPDLG